jgi:tetratricopeptide (TPR) repeat protein
VIRTQYRPLFFLLAISLFFVNDYGLAGRALGQAGGGSVPEDAMGGAALIFRKPDNPALHSGSGSSAGATGGGSLSSRNKKGRTATKAALSAAVAHEHVIAKGNAARSAPTPRYAEAEQQYKLAAAQDPKDARAHAGLGNVYLDQGRFNEAVEAYRQALKISPDYRAAYQPLAFSLVRLGRYAEAVDTLKQALQYDPDSPEIYNNLGFAYVHAARYTDAIAACQKAIELLGKTGEAYKLELQVRNEVLSNAYKNLGNGYNELKRYNDAADALKHATEIEPKNAAAHFNLGLALYNGGRFSEAIEAYKAVVELKPRLAGAHYNLALAYVAINDKESARREYEILKPLNAAMANQLQSAIKR